MVPRPTGRFGSRQRLSLSRQRFFSPVSRQKFCVATGFGDGSGLGREKGLLVSRQSFPKVGTFLSRQGFQGWCCGCFFVATHGPGLRAQQSVGCAHDRPGYARKRAHQRRCCTRDSAHSVHTTARTIGVTGTLSRQTCPVAKKNDPLDLGRHTKAITPIFYNIQSIKQKNG